MSEKLNWQQIEEQYHNEWVELIDCDWDMTEENPQAGIVRIHSRDRKEFDKLLLQDPPKDSAIVYVGKVKLPEGMIFNANLHQYSSTK